jgi:hypothetical protein
MEAVGGDRRITGGGRPGLVGGVKGMIAGPGKEDQSLIKTVRGLGMKTVCYSAIFSAKSKN